MRICTFYGAAALNGQSALFDCYDPEALLDLRRGFLPVEGLRAAAGRLLRPEYYMVVVQGDFSAKLGMGQPLLFASEGDFGVGMPRAENKHAKYFT